MYSVMQVWLVANHNRYLKFVSTDWSGFTSVMAQFDVNEAEQFLEEAKNSDMSEDSKRELEEMLLSMSKLKINTNSMHIARDSDEVKRVIDVLHMLGVAINRLVVKDLFPYNISPLLKWIATIERFFNQNKTSL